MDTISGCIPGPARRDGGDMEIRRLIEVRPACTGDTISGVIILFLHGVSAEACGHSRVSTRDLSLRRKRGRRDISRGECHRSAIQWRIIRHYENSSNNLPRPVSLGLRQLARSYCGGSLKMRRIRLCTRNGCLCQLHDDGRSRPREAYRKACRTTDVIGGCRVALAGRLSIGWRRSPTYSCRATSYRAARDASVQSDTIT